MALHGLSIFHQKVLKERDVKNVCDSLRHDEAFWISRRAVRQQLLGTAQEGTSGLPTASALQFEKAVREILFLSGCTHQLRNYTCARVKDTAASENQFRHVLCPEYPLPPLPATAHPSSLNVLEVLFQNWSDLLLRELKRYAAEQRQPFARDAQAVQSRKEEIESLHPFLKHQTIPNLFAEQESGKGARPLVEIRDLYRLLVSRGPQTDLHWIHMPAQVYVPSFGELRRKMRELNPDLCGAKRKHVNMGADDVSTKERYFVDEVLSGTSAIGPGGMCDERSEECRGKREKEADNLCDGYGEPYAPLVLQFCRRGVPCSLRKDIWRAALLSGGTAGIPLEPTSADASSVGEKQGKDDTTNRSCGAEQQQQQPQKKLSTATFERQRNWVKNVGVALVRQTEWITDEILRQDLSEHAGSDTHYFPFDELTESLVLMLSRDTELFKDCALSPQIPIETAHVDGASTYIPPCGIVPFQGWTAYAGPFCYLAVKLEDAYPLYRAFYCRFFCKLHSISMEQGSLVSLCSLFESLFALHCPKAAHNLMEMSPTEPLALKIAFPWIVSGFAGHLQTDELLLLWDRILGYDSTEIVAVFAAAIFAHKEKLVVNAKNLEDLEVLFADVSHLKVIPLVQQLLWPVGK
ncbi:unnamed protein product [Amoebophrya sp. A25]|nr:unnamed protein product [Amoebophrya sp. A25]|eukprot:GSA25T00023021001.1